MYIIGKIEEEIIDKVYAFLQSFQSNLIILGNKKVLYNIILA